MEEAIPLKEAGKAEEVIAISTGISGAIQHLAGMKDSNVIVTDYGFVGICSPSSRN